MFILIGYITITNSILYQNKLNNDCMSVINLKIQQQQQMQFDEIQVSVVNPQQRSEIGGVNKYYIYTIRGKDNRGDFEVIRRYSDFNQLRQILTKRWPGCYVPSLPEKKTIGSGQHLFVENRRRGLQIFLRTITFSEALWYSEEMQIFIRNNSGDIQKILSPFVKDTYQRILARYKTVFPDLNTGQILKDVITKTIQFTSYLKDGKLFLQKLNDTTQKMYDVFKNNMEKKLNFLEFLLPDYEKSCILANDEKNRPQKLLFMNYDEFSFKEVIEKYKKANQYPPVLLVMEEIRRQKREIQVFEELLRNKNQIQSLKIKASAKVKDIQFKASKITAGKQSLFSIIKKQSKEQQLAENKHDITLAKEEQSLYANLFLIITNLVGAIEIDRFKQIRQKAYYSMLKTFAKYEKEIAQAEHDIWQQAQYHELIYNQNEQNSNPRHKQNSEHTQHSQHKQEYKVQANEEHIAVHPEQDQIKNEQI